MTRERPAPDFSQGETPAELLADAAARAPEAPFAAWREGQGFAERSYAETLARVQALSARYAAAGYGPGHRAALAIGNRPRFHEHYLALNGLGVSIVPLNPDARPAEMAWPLGHSEAVLAVAAEDHRPAVAAALAEGGLAAPLIAAEGDLSDLPPAPSPAGGRPPGAAGECAVLYTSGTTGKPKGCLLSNAYFVGGGRAYAEWGGRLSLGEGERLLNPLPLFHMNALSITTTAMMLTRGCNVMVERFSPAAWWRDCAESGADLIHYLGVMPAMLMARPPEAAERAHRIRAGIGAGVDPEHHAAFEARFGFPLLELWGMTETGRGFIDAFEPRKVGTRAFGRPTAALEAKVVDDELRELPRGTPGELLVRAADAPPEQGLFSGYLKDPEATRAVWAEGWLRTGDVVSQDPDGMLHFVDRRKNIVRRSGENIAAAEVEACLQAHPAIAQAAVLAVPDELREEEVLACLVPAEGAEPGEALAREAMAWTLDRLSYFKAPGWIAFREALPTTGTQKVQKSLIFGDDEDPRARALDLRALKRRDAAPGRQEA